MAGFRAFRVHDQQGTARLETLQTEDLSAGDVVIRTRYSSVNYKDALAATGKGKIMRRFPLVGGVDVAAIVERSDDDRFDAGDEVLVTGCGLGESDDGGFAETVRVPADNVDLVGVRDVVNAEGLDRVFEVLRQPYTEEPTNWSRRYKANLEKLASGDVIKVAEVVRDLWRRERERGLSAGEKRMLAKARQILVSELALAEKTNEDKAEAILDEVLAS